MKTMKQFYDIMLYFRKYKFLSFIQILTDFKIDFFLNKYYKYLNNKMDIFEFLSFFEILCRRILIYFLNPFIREYILRNSYIPTHILQLKQLH